MATKKKRVEQMTSTFEIECIKKLSKPLTIRFESSSEIVTVKVAPNVLVMSSEFFSTLLDELTFDDTNELVVPEDEPAEAANFLACIHERVAAYFPLKWCEKRASLACKWMMDGYISEFGRLAMEELTYLAFRCPIPDLQERAACPHCKAQVNVFDSRGNYATACSQRACRKSLAQMSSRQVRYERYRIRFWRIASTVLRHEPLKKTPSLGLSRFISLLAKRKDLWRKEEMKLLTAEDLLLMCEIGIAFPTQEAIDLI